MRCPSRYVIILLVLAACSSPVPLQPTPGSDISATPAVSVNTNASPLATQAATPASTAAESPLQKPSATAATGPSPIIRLAVIDQSSAVDTSRAGWWSVKTLGPIGQTFKPSFAGLDAIALWTEDEWDEECSGAGVKLQLKLHKAAIDGPLVGLSHPVVLPDCYKGITLFGFPSFIAVTPGQVYVVEVVVLSGDNWGVVWQQMPDSYPRGESIVRGAAGEADVWFQVGLREPTPPTEAYCQNNLWQHVRRASGGAFKDQADCIQYVNTGQ